MNPRALGKALLLAGLLSGMRAEAMENVFILSDTMSYFEKVFGVRSRINAWFGTGNASTINLSFPGKANINFRLAEPAPGSRYIDQVQIEPQSGALLSAEKAHAYARFLVDDLSRQSGAACAPVRDDQDGINAFIVYSCTEKDKPGAPVFEVTTTIQSVNGRNNVFVQFAPKKK